MNASQTDKAAHRIVVVGGGAAGLELVTRLGHRYARSGAHQEAIVAAARGGFFSESMFVRFAPYEIHGQWKGLTIG